MAFTCLSDYYKRSYVGRENFVLSAKIPLLPLSPANSAGLSSPPKPQPASIWHQLPAWVAYMQYPAIQPLQSKELNSDPQKFVQSAKSVVKLNM
jgi:hypothetical protein